MRNKHPTLEVCMCVCVCASTCTFILPSSQIDEIEDLEFDPTSMAAAAADDDDDDDEADIMDEEKLVEEKESTKHVKHQQTMYSPFYSIKTMNERM